MRDTEYILFTIMETKHLTLCGTVIKLTEHNTPFRTFTVSSFTYTK